MLTTASTKEKISVDALPMKPVISNPRPELDWFKARFGLTWDELAEKYNIEEVDRFLLRWRITFPDDPEAWISSANWNWQQSEQPMIYMSTTEGGAYITGEGKDGSVGLHRSDERGNEFFSVGSRTDPARLSEALGFFQNAQQRFPYRVDIYEQLASIYLTLEQYEKAVETLRLMSRSIMETKHSLQGVNYKTVHDSREKVLLSLCHRVSVDLFQVESKAAEDAQLELALLMTRTLPNNAIAWNNLVAAYDRVGNKTAAYQAAQKAYQIDPKDEIIVVNLAKYCFELGFREEAIRHYRWIINNSKRSDLKERARADLELLGVK